MSGWRWVGVTVGLIMIVAAVVVLFWPLNVSIDGREHSCGGGAIFAGLPDEPANRKRPLTDACRNEASTPGTVGFALGVGGLVVAGAAVFVRNRRPETDLEER